MKAVNKLELIIARDFSKSPGPRDKEEGDFSGEQFREEVLLPKLHEAQSKGCVLLVDLDPQAAVFVVDRGHGDVRHTIFADFGMRLLDERQFFSFT